jgi:hypothetical protein
MMGVRRHLAVKSVFEFSNTAFIQIIPSLSLMKIVWLIVPKVMFTSHTV